MVLVLEGMPYFAFPEKMKEFMRFVLEQDDRILRLVGGFAMLVGLIVVFVARRGLTIL
jgi:uncharacterized protein YjeT (DUF2065 family)